MSDEPFGRQPQPVHVLLTGDINDVDNWRRRLMRHAESTGDNVERRDNYSFTIYPRAVND